MMIGTEYRSTHFFPTWGEFDPTLENVVALICLLVFRETNAFKIVLDDTDEKELEALKTMPTLGRTHQTRAPTRCD